MSEKDDGAIKPFYENIVSKRTRTRKPPKPGKEGSENAGLNGGDRSSVRSARPDSDSRSGDRPFRGDAPRGGNEAPRAGSEARFGREATKRDSPSNDRFPRQRSDSPRRDAPRSNAPRSHDAPRDSRGPGRDESRSDRSSRPSSPDSRPRSDSRESGGYAGRSSTPRSDDRQGRTGPREGFARPYGDSPRGAEAPRSHAPRKPFDPPKGFTPVFGDLPKETRELLDAFPDIIQSVMPLDSKKQLLLPTDIRDLSHELTDERGDRRVGYMNDPAVLSAYIRYYMWWNLVRLTRLFASLPISLADGDAAVDIGSGPLTLPIALWMSRRDLRDKKITWYCVDISQGALAAGEELFLSLAARTGNEPWQIVRIKGECGVSLRRRVALVASANMFNELFWDNPLPLEAQSKHHAEEISSYAESESAILVVEPGVPRAGRFVSLLRDSLMRLGFAPVAPCPHEGECPFPGLRYGKWCHFVFDTTDAPAKLHKLSDEAGLVKERAALSFIYAERKKPVAGETEAGNADTGPDGVAPAIPAVPPVSGETSVEAVSRLSGLFTGLRVRITSDTIKLPDFYTGRYGCSSRGMVMLTGTFQAADWLKDCNSGSLVEVPNPDRRNPEIDPKTGAIIIRLK